MRGTLLVYGAYLLSAIALIGWLGTQLHRNGRVFLEDVFAAQPGLGSAVSRLLVSGFVLFTLGYALLLLDIDVLATADEAIEASAAQFGQLLLSLGVLHMVNMGVLMRLRRRFGPPRSTGRRSGPSQARA